MGQRHSHSMIDHKLSLTLSYSDYDQLIFILYKFIKDEIDKEIISKKFPYINITAIIEIKSNNKSKKNFLDWYKKWHKNDEQKKIEKIRLSTISPIISYKSLELPNRNSLRKSSSNFDEQEEISECEKSLRKYYLNNQKEFKLKTLYNPSEPFRFLNWIICANVPEIRLNEYYQNIIKHSLKEEIKDLINKDINRTLEENKISSEEIYESLFRILKAIALLDKEMSYCQGMNFICGFMLIILEGNEIDSFFLLMSLFSQTFISSKFDLRGFFIEKFPLLGLYIYIFKFYLRKKFKKVFEHFNKLEIPNQSWIGKWFQSLFVHTFPIDDVIRIWDGIFSEGLKFIISFSLSIINSLENQILKSNDLIEVIELFQMLNSSYYNIKGGFKYDIEKMIEDAKVFYISTEDFNKLTLEYENNKIDIEEKEEYKRDLSDVYKIYEYSSFQNCDVSEKDNISIIQGLAKQRENEVLELRKKQEEEENIIQKINEFLSQTDYSDVNININELTKKIPNIDNNESI